jgi:hypothetical protein
MRLEKTKYYEPFDIPHFGTSTEINFFVKILLSFVHGGFLWLDRQISIDTDLITCIIGFPSKGEAPSPLFTYKKKDKALAKRMKDKYGTFRGAHGLDVASINDDTLWFTT